MTPHALPAAVRETFVESPPSLVHAPWRERFPWLVQGCTTRGGDVRPFDLGLFADASPARHVLAAWQRLREETGLPRAVHAHQVHGAAVRRHGSGPGGLFVSEDCDGHVTAEPGVLLGVTTADCVPVFLVGAASRVVGALHAGWRGAAAGVLEAGLEAMRAGGARLAGVHAHLGPAICGECYEVGPEVFAALAQPVPVAPAALDLRAVLAARAARAGVLPRHITASTHCTRCTGSGLFSHRGGDGERQVGFIGVRP